MPRALSPAQIANQITFRLKGDLKNAQIAYIRAAKLLAQVRDEKLWQALRFQTIEEYAAKRLQLQRSALYHYLQIHDWLRRFHPSWLAQKPKGFIPDLTEASALMWIDRYLEAKNPPEALRKELEAMRRKALSGALTDREFRALRDRLRGSIPPLRAILRRMKSLRRAAVRVPRFPADALASLDASIGAVEQSLASAEESSKLAARRASALARGSFVRERVIV
jgi:hypothetical protein